MPDDNRASARTPFKPGDRARVVEEAFDAEGHFAYIAGHEVVVQTYQDGDRDVRVRSVAGGGTHYVLPKYLELIVPETLYTIPDVAAALGVSTDTVYRIIARGRLTAVDIATGSRTRLRVRHADLTDYIASNTRGNL